MVDAAKSEICVLLFQGRRVHVKKKLECGVQSGVPGKNVAYSVRILGAKMSCAFEFKVGFAEWFQS